MFGPNSKNNLTVSENSRSIAFWGRIISMNLRCSIVPNFLSNKRTFFFVWPFFAVHVKYVFISSAECIKGFIVFWYILKCFYSTVNSNLVKSSIIQKFWCRLTILIVTLPYGSIVPHFSLMLIRVFPYFFVVVVLFVAVPAVLPFSIAFRHSSVGGPFELLTFVQLFSGSPPWLDYKNFVISWPKKMTIIFTWKKREETLPSQKKQ